MFFLRRIIAVGLDGMAVAVVAEASARTGPLLLLTGTRDRARQESREKLVRHKIGGRVGEFSLLEVWEVYSRWTT